MRCFVSLLLLGLCLSVDAHNTPRIRDESYTHTPFKDWHERVRARWPEDHWHYSERQAGAWYRCVADVYDETTDRYDFAAMRVRCGDGGRSTNSEANAPALPTSTPPTIHPEVPRDDTQRESENLEQNTDSMEAFAFTYDHTFPTGVSLQHIPLDITDFNNSGIAVNSVPGVFDQLGDSVALLIASRGASGWTYVTYPNFPAHNAIWKSIGFVAVMHEEVTVKITGTFVGWTGSREKTFQTLYLRQGGLTLLGVPLQSVSLRTVGDFYKFFSNVESVMGINPDLEIDTMETPIRVEDDWFVELDRDTVIDGYTSYLIRSDGAAQRTLWGVPWGYDQPSSAPPAEQWAYYKKMATTWGAIKNSGQ